MKLKAEKLKAEKTTQWHGVGKKTESRRQMINQRGEKIDLENTGFKQSQCSTLYQNIYVSIK